MLNNKQAFVIYKKRSFYTIFSLFMIAVLALVPLQADAKAKSKRSKPKENYKYAAFVMDVGTGVILHQENAGKQLHPASLTKMMTLMMLFDAMEKGKVKRTDRIVISKHAASMPPSKIGLKPGSTIKVEDAIYALVTKSANDIAAAVGEHLGKTESNFATMMTRKAREVGMPNTTFRNASGLHNPAQVTTARDMARLGYLLVTDYRKYYPYFSTKNFSYRGANYHNHNRLMDSYKGMDGLKTGYIGPSGFNLVASAVRDNNRLIGVVFGGRSAQSRNARMKDILDQSFMKLKSGGTVMAQMDTSSVPLASLAQIPVPGKKPEASLEVAALQLAPLSPPQVLVAPDRLIQEEALSPSGVEVMSSAEGTSRWALLEPSAENSMFSRMIGEGDYDSAVRSRLQTGLIAIAAHTRQPIPQEVWAIRSDEAPYQPNAPVSSFKQNASFQPAEETDWSIQVGAFTNRERTDKILAESMKKLPESLRTARSVVAPVQTAQGWIFRARINGYSKAAAEKACSILSDCIAIAPDAN